MLLFQNFNNYIQIKMTRRTQYKLNVCRQNTNNTKINYLLSILKNTCYISNICCINQRYQCTSSTIESPDNFHLPQPLILLLKTFLIRLISKIVFTKNQLFIQKIVYNFVFNSKIKLASIINIFLGNAQLLETTRFL